MKIKSPIRFLIFVVTVLIVIWMCYNFIIALHTGEKFNFFGNGTNANGEIKNFVVAGVDEDGYRTDLILLCQVDNRNREVEILQIPRDTKITNKRNDKKINSAYYSGFDVMANEIEQVTGIKPDDYIIVDFDGFRDLINAMGGVKIDVPVDMKYSDPTQDLEINLKKGKQKLNGKEAEMYMRFRSGYKDGDIGRLGAQQELYSAVADQLLSAKGVIRSPLIFLAIISNTKSSFTMGEIIGLMKDVLVIGKDNINVHSLPGAGQYIGGGSYFVHSKNQTKSLISENFVLE